MHISIRKLSLIPSGPCVYQVRHTKPQIKQLWPPRYAMVANHYPGSGVVHNCLGPIPISLLHYQQPECNGM